MITGHAITVNLTWWNSALHSRSLPGGPVVGIDASGAIVDSGRAVITRGDVFNIARGGRTPESALRLLWHSLAWGSGGHVRNNHQRMDSVAKDPEIAADALKAAAELSESSPADAFDALYPRGRSLLSGLGPAFFTKFLYFAGAGAVNHPCVILDNRVAAALNQAGWTSLSTRGPWPADAYARYCTLLSRWAGEVGPAPQRPDLIERWLFDQGGPDR
ncbi:8-oxoguanine DNA glycosylase OGG fold protein [Rhodococcus wratislaviensis]|uniref:8-oxoguanine DNA glycosylase OGG fold protein n=1 Tax=Rhodococcus wratislaviensis TaxID=44752 RepID=UPI00364F0B8C